MCGISHFNLGRQRAVDDDLIVPLVDQLLSSCGLVLLNPSNVGTHSAGAALDLVMMSSSCSGSVRVHDGMGCCNHAPGCCPLLGSDHCLCVAATTLRRQVRAQVPRCLPPLRDWHPVLLRAHNDLVGWAQEVDTCLCGDIPSNEHHRVRIIDFLYHRMVSILSWHVPHQHRSRHRCQPSWWSPECLARCVARSGAWRDFRRSRSPETYSRFRVARMAFHRTVRKCQRTFWTDWQEPLASSCCCFNGSSNFFLFPAGWIMRLVSCGSPWLRMSVPPIGASISRPLASASESSLKKSRRGFASSILNQWSPGLFDAPFTPSELRRWTPFLILLWVSTDCRTLCSISSSLGQVVPTPWKRSIVVPVFKRGAPSLPTSFRTISLANCCFKIFEHLVHARIGPHISPQLDECQRVFRWGADSLVGSLVDLLTSRSSSHTFVAFIDIHKAFDTS